MTAAYFDQDQSVMFVEVAGSDLFFVVLALARLGNRLRIVHSLPAWRRLMDAVQRFRRQVARELGDRQGAERRYSADLRQQRSVLAGG